MTNNHDDGQEDLGSSENPLERNREKLAKLFPGVFSDGRVDCEELQKLTGIELEESKDRYGLSWAGKAKCFKEIERTTTKTLRVDRDASVDFDTTENLFIDGDNLEALKVLQRSYYGKVKMIYIDPPYNTGHDFIYNDKFARSESEEGAESGTRDAEGNLTRTDRLMMNDRSKGRFHSNWLNMMYPRLYLARNLLKSDGVIFVSIDDNEVTNLRMTMDEIFGEENFVAQIVVQTNPRGRTLDKYLAKTFEYILVYVKDFESDAVYQIPKSVKAIAAYDKEDGRGPYRLLELRNRNPAFNRGNRPNLFFSLFVDPDSSSVALEKDSAHRIEVLPLNSKEEEGCWTWGREHVAKDLEDLVGRQASTGAWRIFRKDHLNEGSDTTKEKSLWIETEMNHEYGKEELGRLFEKTPFDFPKSINLLQKCINLGTKHQNEDIILDFFAGSGTTAHAVMAQNAEDGGNRKWICVQLPEETGEESEARKVGYETIADISRERIRRAGKKVVKENSEKLAERKIPLDIGFKALKLEDSNFKVWNTDVQTEEQLQGQLRELLDSPYAADATEENMLNELILKNGLPLTVSVEKKDGYYVVGGNLVISLVDEMIQGIFTAILAEKPTKIILLDTSFRSNDQLKTNLLLQAKDQGVGNVVVV